MGNPLVSFVSCSDGGEVIGIFMINVHGMYEIEVHEAFLPSAWGPRARRAAREFREWLWDETGVMRVIGRIVASNRVAIEYALASGMKIFGVDEKSFFKDGKLQDQVFVGISRPEGRCR